ANRGDLETERLGRRLNLLHLQYVAGAVGISDDAQPAEAGNKLAREFEALSSEVRRLDRQAGEVAAGPRQTRDEAVPERVCCQREDDRYDRGSLLCRNDRYGCSGDNDIDLEPDELGRELGGARAGSPLPSVPRSRCCGPRSNRVRAAGG